MVGGAQRIGRNQQVLVIATRSSSHAVERRSARATGVCVESRTLTGLRALRVRVRARVWE